jgi:uncharacterized membrane protein
MKFIKDNQLPLLVILGMVSSTIYFYQGLPALLPTKFDLNGQPTHYMSKDFVAWLNPCIYFAVFSLVQFLIKVSPEKFAMEQSRKALRMAIFGLGLLLLGIHLGTLTDPRGGSVFLKFVSDGSSAFLIVVGNVMGKMERNFFIGIRTPWTLASEENWHATHRFGGKMMVMFGMVLFVVSFSYVTMPIVIAAILIPLLIPVGYSYLYYRRQQKA